MMRTIAFGAAALVALFSACAPQPSQTFDPQDPEVLAVIDSMMAGTMEAAARVDADGVLAVVTGNVMLTGIQTVRDAFADTYEGLLSQKQTLYEKRVRLLSPDVAVWTGVGEGVYTDKAGWTSEPVGLGLTVIFVREDGRWTARYVHQSIEK